MKHETMNRTIGIAYFMLEGNSYTEAAEEFSIKRSMVKRCINEYLPYINPQLYILIKNKPIMVLNRVKNKGISLEEACSYFKISAEKVDLFLKQIAEKDPRSYIRYKSYIYMNSRGKPV